MSGRAKHILFIVMRTVFDLLAYAAMVLMALFVHSFHQNNAWISLSVAFVVVVVLSFSVVVHEMGHMFFGFLSSMKFVSVTIGFFMGYLPVKFAAKGKRVGLEKAYAPVGGHTEMFVKNNRNARTKVILYSLGGVIFNLLYAFIFGCFYFLLPQNPVLLVFELFAPVCLVEGVFALVPFDDTDGAVALGLCKKRANEEVMLRVMGAQALLYRNGYDKIKRECLFDTPVVKVDLPSFVALSLLRAQYLLYHGDFNGAICHLNCLEEEMEFLPEGARIQLLSELIFATARVDLEKACELLSQVNAEYPYCSYYRALLSCGLVRLDEVKEKIISSLKGELLYGVRDYEKKMLLSLGIEI